MHLKSIAAFLGHKRGLLISMRTYVLNRINIVLLATPSPEILKDWKSAQNIYNIKYSKRIPSCIKSLSTTFAIAMGQLISREIRALSRKLRWKEGGGGSQKGLYTTPFRVFLPVPYFD